MYKVSDEIMMNGTNRILIANSNTHTHTTLAYFHHRIIMWSLCLQRLQAKRNYSTKSSITARSKSICQQTFGCNRACSLHITNDLQSRNVVRKNVTTCAVILVANIFFAIIPHTTPKRNSLNALCSA